MQETVTYEQPLNERVRTLLRLEFLFQQSDHFLTGQSGWDSRGALHALIDTLNVLHRADLKTEFVKEMERQAQILSRLKQAPGVDLKQLDAILDQLDTYSDQLLAISGMLGQELRQNELLNAIRQRSSIAGGTCDFDLPLLHYWLERETETRLYDLKTWQQALRPVRNGVKLLTKLIRESTLPSSQRAANGFYQQSLESNVQYQLIRVTIPREYDIYPEISGGRHRFTVRFMKPALFERPQQITQDIDFDLTLCAL